MTTHSSTISLYPDLRGKVALVTGGSRGIGAATCRALAASGAKVAVNGRDEAAIQAVVASIRDAGGGTGRPQPLGEISEQDWRSSLDNNLTSTFFTLQCFLPGMMARGAGSAVTMASAGGRVASGAPAGYGAAKAGVIMLTRHAAVEAGPAGVRVNCLSPSAVLTERTALRMPDAQRRAMLPAFPLGRLGEPDDVAAAALFLLSSASGWITGVTLDVAGEGDGLRGAAVAGKEGGGGQGSDDAFASDTEMGIVVARSRSGAAPRRTTAIRPAQEHGAGSFQERQHDEHLRLHLPRLRRTPGSPTPRRQPGHVLHTLLLGFAHHLPAGLPERCDFLPSDRDLG